MYDSLSHVLPLNGSPKTSFFLQKFNIFIKKSAKGDSPLWPTALNFLLFFLQINCIEIYTMGNLIITDIKPYMNITKNYQNLNFRRLNL